MGRTVESYRTAIEKEIKTWEGFRKALRNTDAEAFEKMMDACRIYASAGSSATRPILFEAMVMSILLSQQKMLMKLKDDFEDLKKKIQV